MDALHPRSQYSPWALGLEAGTSLRLFSFPLGYFRAIIADCSPPLCCSRRCPQATDNGPVIRIDVNQIGVLEPLQFYELRFTFSKTTFFA